MHKIILYKLRFFTRNDNILKKLKLPNSKFYHKKGSKNLFYESNLFDEKEII